MTDAAAMPFDVTVIIVSYRSAEDIRGCLKALERSTYRAFKVVICENGGEEAFQALKRTLPARLDGGQPIELLLAPENLGYAGGINFCLDHARSEAYWILNPDTEPSPDALEALIARLKQNDCGAVGHDLILSNGMLASLGGGRWGRWSARPISINHGRPREGNVDAKAIEDSLDYIVGASMLVSAGFLERIGRMRDDYFLYCEETEWCLRAKARGEKLGYAPQALVLHAHGTSTGGGGSLRSRSRVAVYLAERNRLLVTRDIFPHRLPYVAPISLAHMIFKYGKARAWRQVGYAVAGWLAGLRNERGKPAWFSNVYTAG
jgi:GT2 family glycosyltransferase